MFRLVNKLKNKKGFTLIELIIVLAILGIISAIAVPRFAGIQDDAKVKADKATASGLAKATELAIVNDKVNVPASSSTAIDIDSDLVDNGYLDSKPTPQKGGSFTVELHNDGKITVKSTHGGVLYGE